MCEPRWGLRSAILYKGVFLILTQKYSFLFSFCTPKNDRLFLKALFISNKNQLVITILKNEFKSFIIYCSLLTAMIVGRLVWGGSMYALMGLSGGSFTFAAFLSGAIFNAIPGIILQILLIPFLVRVLDNPKSKCVR